MSSSTDSNSVRDQRRFAVRLYPMAAAVVAFVLAFCVFAPRFLVWTAIDLPSSEHNPPEVNRAIDTLRQVDDPFIRITNPTNRVNRWRLLFPMLGHYLHIPRNVFLGLPHLGCFFVLWYTATLVDRAAGNRWLTLMATTLVATTSWFFVSTGWLAYFDSWYLLGLLLVAFSERRTVLVAACLLVPWVDERFLLALPLSLAIRGIYTGRGRPGRLLNDVGIVVATTALYVAIRVCGVALDWDQGSVAHVKSHLEFQLDPRQLLDGLWSGLRLVWVFVAVALGLSATRRGPAWAVLLTLIVLATLGSNVVVAHDLSRSVSTLVPAVVLGMLLLIDARPRIAKMLFALILLGNLLLPARHVIAGWEAPSPITNIYREWQQLRHPPPLFANVDLAQGGAALRRGDWSKALDHFDRAARVNPNLIDAQLQRGLCLERLSRVDEAEACFSAAMRRFPGRAEPYYFRGLLRSERGASSPAAEDFRKALELSPPTAPYRRDLERRLNATLESAGPAR